MTVSQRPLPVPDEETRGFWEKASEHVLAIQRCHHCGNLAHPPVPFCSVCHRLDRPSFSFEPVSGRGRLVSWTVIDRSMVTGFEHDGPITNALVRLDEQDDLLMMATLEPSEVPFAIGQAVHVVFLDVSPDISLPMFQIVGDEE
jgi:uncharacterized protein